MDVDPLTEDWRAASYGLARERCRSGDLAEAFEMLLGLLRVDSDPLWTSRGRTLLATICDDLGWYESPLYQFEVAIGIDADHELTADARLDRDQAANRRDEVVFDSRLPLLQTRCCLERLVDDADNVEELERLARVVRALGSGPDQLIAISSARPVLQDAMACHPESVDVARGLLSCDLLIGDQGQVDESLDRLDDLEPESRELESIATRLARGGSPVSGSSDASTPLLMGVVQGGHEPAFARAALADLEHRVARPPNDDTVTLLLGIALLMCGATDNLPRLLDSLVNRPRRDQTFHYNLCQLLAAVGDHERANDHLDLARQFANTPEEQEEVAALYASNEWAIARGDD